MNQWNVYDKAKNYNRKSLRLDSNQLVRTKSGLLSFTSEQGKSHVYV